MGPSTAQPNPSVSRTGLPANQLAPAGARSLVRAALTEWTRPTAPAAGALPKTLADDAVLLASELVTNAVMYAGTDIDVTCRLDLDETTAVVVEVVDRHPAKVVRGGVDARHGAPGYGLQLVSALAESWGVTYQRDAKAVWFRLEADGAAVRGPEPAGDVAEVHVAESPVREGEPVRRTAPAPPTGLSPTPGTAPAPVTGPPATPPPTGPPATPPPSRPRPSVAEWADRGGSSFLAETSELLAGQLDQDMVTALAAQLLVPRLADWCAIWLTTERRGRQLSRVWHVDEQRVEPLRRELNQDPPTEAVRVARTPWPWPRSAGDVRTGGSALAFPLVARDTDQGVLLLGRAGQLWMTDAVARIVEDVARRVAQAVYTARQYTRQTTISRALQRRQLPVSLARIPGVDTAVVYEPHGEGTTVGGDFYDVFPMGRGRWCFLLGDVQGKDPEAMSVTGLARHLVRLLAREGHGVESVLGRLNLAMAEESAEAVETEGDLAGPRFLSLLYGELSVDPAVPGARCTVAAAGHPPPLHLFTDGTVEPACDPQMLLGIDEGAEFRATAFDLAPGDTLLCVTDGVTERRCGNWQLDDNDGLTQILREGLGLGAKALAEHVRRAAHDFGTGPVEDDLSVLVLQAVGGGGTGRP